MSTSRNQTTIFYLATVPLRIELRTTLGNDLLIAKPQDCQYAMTKSAIKQIVCDAHKAKMSYEDGINS